jgi:transcriptional regulator with XRE-family HTH domain
MTTVTYGKRGGNSETPDLRKTSEGESVAFPARLKKAIGGESIRGFARKAGISSSVVHNYIDGKSEPSRPILLSMAAAADVQPLWLITGAGPMRRGEEPQRRHLVKEAGVSWSNQGGTAEPYDEKLLLAVVEGVEEQLEEEGKKLTPAKKAELVALCYRYGLTRKPELERKSLWKRLVKLSA